MEKLNSTYNEATPSGDETVKTLMYQRQQLVQNFCKRNKRNDSTIGKDLRYHLVFHTKKIIYCFAPKVASSQWKKELHVLNEDNGRFTHGEFKRLNQYSPEDALEMLENYFTFLFVRDPFERLLSAYKSKFLKQNRVFHQTIGRKIIKLSRPNATKHALDAGNDVTFPEFVNYVLKTRHFDEHWRTFDQLCYPCAIRYDFIGHLENLAQDASYLVKMAGIQDRISFPPFQASRTTSELLHYYSQIPKQKILQLAKLYKSDFEMFGYAFPGRLEALVTDSSDT